MLGGQRQGTGILPFLEQSGINNTHKKESRQLGVAQSEEADRQRTSRVKHKTNRTWDLLGGQIYKHPETTLRFGQVLSMLHMVCSDNQM